MMCNMDHLSLSLRETVDMPFPIQCSTCANSRFLQVANCVTESNIHVVPH